MKFIFSFGPLVFSITNTNKHMYSEKILKTRFLSLPWLIVLNAGVSKQNLHFSSFPWQPEKKKHIWSFAEYSLGFGHYFCVPITKSYDNRTMWCRHFCLSVATGNILFEFEIQKRTYSSSIFIMFHITIEDLATYDKNVSTYLRTFFRLPII